MNEAEFLAALRALPLHPAARGLLDDTALLDARGPLVLTSDTIVEGIHFLSTDPAEDVAWKLGAVNLSDLAAKGALPLGMMLNYTLTGDSAWDAGFIKGLRQLDCALIGGDTVSLPSGAPRVLTLTAFGSDATAPLRSGARASDALYVTGTIGDAGAGLSIAQGMSGPAELLAAYRRPMPRIADGRALAPLVHAMMDVSDGLLIDGARMAEASGLALEIDLAAVPLSPAYRRFVGDDRDARIAAATAGDDYQLLFVAPPRFALPVPATRIGSFSPGAGLCLMDGAEAVALPPRLGFEHAA
ncbi:thiamine-phosphate kinase [Sphingomonas sp. QA11]|uniref:thiamine-phosphate kinase n=1 Tax=Sphingomonas sp. QA11 TaxID=2950605 RepID=UPI00234AC972|nr:thiamine-phosphate kinase [Sphingomonas sp. QA11]WCM25769.1 thiamine-phosphate kinase [Sphingomonas sp. QA11]